MILKKIVLDNIRSYKHSEVYFKKGLTLLSGDVGSGKTSVLLAIEFAFFGLQPGQRGSSLLREGEEEGKVCLTFSIEDKEIIITRELLRKKKISQGSCLISINGLEQELSVTELKMKVLQLFGYPTEFLKRQNLLYKFTIYTPQEEMKQIILQDPLFRMNTLRSIFGIDKYKQIIENSHLLLAKLREEKRLKQGELIGLEEDKRDLGVKQKEAVLKEVLYESKKRELSLKKIELQKIKEEKEILEEKIKEKISTNQEIEKIKIIASNKLDLFSSNKKTILKLDSDVKEKEEESSVLLKIPEIEKEIFSLKKKKEETNIRLSELNSNINSLEMKNEDSERLTKNMSNLQNCPTCLQDVDAVYRANILNKAYNERTENNKLITLFLGEKKELSNKIISLNEELESYSVKLNNLKILEIEFGRIDEKKKRLELLESENNSLEKNLNLLKDHLEGLEKEIFKLRGFDSIFEIKKQELEITSQIERKMEMEVVGIKKELEFFFGRIKELEIKIAKSEDIKEQVDNLIKIENWLTDSFIPLIISIERNVMVKIRWDFSNLFSDWFSLLVSDYFEASIDSEFSPMIEQKDYQIDYAYLSGGERTAVAFAYRLALTQVLNSLMSSLKTKNILILDEPTEGFSERQLDRLRDIFQAVNVEQLIIVSHEQKIGDFVEHIIRFRKKEKVTFIEE